MNRGIVQQDGAPRTLYDAPANIFVATFIGSPAMNLLEGRLEGAGSCHDFVLGRWRLPLPKILVKLKPSLIGFSCCNVIAGIRPEYLKLGGSSSTLPGLITGTVKLVEDQGSSILVHLDIDVPAPRLDFDRIGLPADTRDVVKSEISQLRMRLNGSERVSPGEKIPIALDLAHLHFFEQASGLAIE
jgi:multiple sugar transport system ATP-binding protein